MMVRCENCGDDVIEVCPDGYCRKCHVSLSFEDCCDGTWNVKLLLGQGMPLDLVKKAYPKSRIWFETK